MFTEIYISDGLRIASTILAAIVGYIGICIMAYGCIKGGYFFFITSITGRNRLPHIRIDVGKHLALGLEFLVAKDLIQSIIRPSWDDLGKLAIVVALRTFVTLFLSWELKEVKEELEEGVEHAKAMKHLRKKF